MLGEREHHRRVEPEDGLGANARRDQHVEQLAQPCLDLLGIPPMRKARAQRDHVVGGEGMVFEKGQRVVAGDVFFPDEDALSLREPLHQMLRALRDEIPAEMREADQRRRGGIVELRGRENRSDTVHALPIRKSAVIRVVDRT
ncbi:hypothetical protein [Sphingomonas sp. LR55]|uniref:hypothetical protein n=1 Tax=Sphingomonas sp. LR55 TaxID=3050231 RepID=UPI002FE2381B